MTGGEIPALVLAGIVTALLVRSFRKGKGRWGQIACPVCNGDGWEKNRIWHWGSMRHRVVRRPCPRCGGDPWSAR